MPSTAPSSRVGELPGGTLRRLVNVVVFVSDALRTDHVGCYGARYVNTRTVDELAAGGVRFDQAISVAPWTCPSMTSMVTGLYPHHHGYLHWDAPLPDVPTLFSAGGCPRPRRGHVRLRRELPLQGVARRERRSARASASTARSRGCASIVTGRSFSSCTAGRRTCRTTSSTPSARSGSRRRRS